MSFLQETERALRPLFRGLSPRLVSYSTLRCQALPYPRVTIKSITNRSKWSRSMNIMFEDLILKLFIHFMRIHFRLFQLGRGSLDFGPNHARRCPHSYPHRQRSSSLCWVQAEI